MDQRIIKKGEVIASYPDDVPFPSVLILGFEEREFVHVWWWPGIGE